MWSPTFKPHLIHVSITCLNSCVLMHVHMYVPRRIPFAYEHSFIGNITFDFIDYKSATIPLRSAFMLSVLWKAGRFFSKELSAFKESASVKQNGRKQAVIIVEPRFNEVPRDWGNLFVVSRVQSLKRTPRFNEFSKRQPKCSSYQGIVNN